MKTWKKYSKEEQRMLIIIGVLLIVVLLSFGRVTNGIKNGIGFFFGKENTEMLNDTN